MDTRESSSRNMVISNEGVKSSNIWKLVSVTTTFWLKLVAEWRRVITFSRQNDAGSRLVSSTQYRENLVLEVVLVLEFKDI